MSLESVRIMHAQSVPGYYFVNQIYQPTDEDARQLGSLLILLQHEATVNGAFVASLVNTLIREYYRQDGPDRLACFEQALIRINDQIKQFHLHHSAEEAKVNGTIALTVGDEVHLTYIGTPMALLARHNTILSLAESPLDETESALFGVITSGQIITGDVLILLNSIPHSTNAEEDLTFALEHTPFSETARAFSRLLQEHALQTVEAMMIRFNEEDDVVSQLFIDRPLETPSEKLETYKKSLVRHAAFLGSGMEYLYKSTATKLPQAKSAAKQLVPQLPHRLPVTPRPRAAAPRVKMPSQPARTRTARPAIERSEGYEIKTYWQAPSAKRAAPKALPQTVVHEFSAPMAMRSNRMLPELPFPNQRTVSLLAGILLLIYIMVHAANAVPKTVPHADTTINIQALESAAQNAERDATQAQIQGDTATAIAKYLVITHNLAQIPAASLSEQYKAMLSSAQDTLNTLTKTSKLQSSGTQPTLDETPQKIVGAAGQSYAFYKSSAQTFKNKNLADVAGLPNGFTVIDAASYNAAQTVAVVGQLADQSFAIYTIDVASGQATSVTRSDHKAWPPIKYIAGTDKALYLVGSSVWKAQPRTNGTYRVTEYIATVPSTLSGITAAGTTLYAIDTQSKLYKLSSTGITDISITGVPSSFLPNRTNRLFASHKGTALFLFDAQEQRIVQISLTGTYMRQYTLPASAHYIDCDAGDNGFLCTTQNKQIQTLGAS